jgi:lysophospholipase L1-like esterase
MSDGSNRQREQTFQLQDLLFVALGDSYYCGEGTPDVPGETVAVTGSFACNGATFTKFLQEKAGLQVPMKREAEWQEKLVHRSHNNGVVQAVRALEDQPQGRVITFLNFARSGASIEKGFLAPREDDDWTTIGEVEEAKTTVGDRPIDVLLISAGGNDVEFSDRLIDLLRDDLPVVGAGGILGDEALNRQQEYEEVLRLLDELPDKLDRLAAAIEELNPGHVFITPYPLAQFDVINEEGEVETRSGCGIFDGPDMDVDAKDAQLMKESGKKLNAKLQEAARRHGWHYVDGIVEGFAGHGRCSDDKYFYSAEESCFTQGDFRGTLHPNRKGYRVYADAIVSAVRAYAFSE